MANTTNFILMADIVGSRKTDQRMLMNDFKKIIAHVNKEEKKEISLPDDNNTGR